MADITITLGAGPQNSIDAEMLMNGAIQFACALLAVMGAVLVWWLQREWQEKKLKEEFHRVRDGFAAHLVVGLQELKTRAHEVQNLTTAKIQEVTATLEDTSDRSTNEHITQSLIEYATMARLELPHSLQHSDRHSIYLTDVTNEALGHLSVRIDRINRYLDTINHLVTKTTTFGVSDLVGPLDRIDESSHQLSTLVLRALEKVQGDGRAVYEIRPGIGLH
jgi:hypothetical protein